MSTVQARVFILTGGKLQIFIDTGTEEEAKIASEKIILELKASGTQFASIGEVEFHRTGGSHAHVVNEVKHEHRI